MERGSIEQLLHDKRLRLRNGWISKEETESYLASLPDVSDKIAVADEEPEEQDPADPSGEVAPSTPADPAPGTPETEAETPVDPLSPRPFREV